MQFSVIGLDSYFQYPRDQTRSWERRNDKFASAQICLRLPQAQYKQVSSCKNTCAIDIHEETAQPKAANLFIEFTRYKKSQAQTMESYLDKLIELYQSLQVYNVKIGEIARNAKGLDELPETYQQIKAAVRTTQTISIPWLTNFFTQPKETKGQSRGCTPIQIFQT